jgi:uncharacterized protein YjbI with pentapeptide repeats
MRFLAIPLGCAGEESAGYLHGVSYMTMTNARFGTGATARSVSLRAERLFTENEKRSLHGLSLRSTSFDHVDFSGADLTNAVFDGVSLIGCDFRSAKLTLATFRCCDLRDALFDRSTLLGGSRFDGSSLLGSRGLSRSGRALVCRTGGILLGSVLA